MENHSCRKVTLYCLHDVVYESLFSSGLLMDFQGLMTITGLKIEEIENPQDLDRKETRMTHPLAFTGNKGGFIDGNERKVVAGDRIEYRFENHRRGILVEALQGGDAFVTWDDGSHATVKWHHLAKIPE